jgi:hypothetical protein
MSKAAMPPAGGLNRKTLIYVTIAVVVIAAIVAIGLANRGAVSNASQTVNPDAKKLVVGSVAPTFNITSDAGPFDLAGVSTPVRSQKPMPARLPSSAFRVAHTASMDPRRKTRPISMLGCRSSA